MENIKKEYNPFNKEFSIVNAGDNEISFGLGKRKCIGFRLAMIWGSLFMTKLIQRQEIESDPDFIVKN